MAAPRFSPAVVVAAWNRPLSLQRLLDGLGRSEFPQGTTLHISIDQFQYDDVFRLAEAYVWPHGPKVLEQHSERLGLRKHLLHCGGLALRYGSILLLEDDLGISPQAHAYAQAALEFFEGENAVAGISLYCYAVAESCLQPFQPWIDEWDNWFLQVPSSWGLAVTAVQWQVFVDWLSENEHALPKLPGYIASWTGESWKKLFAAYLIATGKYFVYPRVALTTNFEDFGATAKTRDLYQVPMLMGAKTWKFGHLSTSSAVYDAHFEPLPANLARIAPELAGYDFAVDLLGTKEMPFLDRPWVLTRRKGGQPVMQFPASAIPLEMNLLLQGQGDALQLVRSDADLQALDPHEIEFRYYSGPARSPVHHLQDRRMPSLTVILATGFLDPSGEGLARLIAEPYPGLEVVAIVRQGAVAEPVWAAFRAGRLRMVEQVGSDFEGIQRAVESSSGLLIHILDQAALVVPGYAERVARIFHQFPGLDWLSGLPTEGSEFLISRRMAIYRWDKDRFAEANAAQIGSYLPAGLQVFRRSLWMSAHARVGSLAEKFRQMATLALPQVSELEISTGLGLVDVGPKAIWGNSLVSRTRSHYHRHVWILWRRHQRLAGYRPVLRYDASHGTWYEFPY